MDVRCPPEAVSLLYLNPSYDWESGESNNQRLEPVFLEHRERSRPSSWGCSGEGRAFYFRRLEDLFVLFGDNVTTLLLRQM
jgi:hypothetical protein